MATASIQIPFPVARAVTPEMVNATTNAFSAITDIACDRPDLVNRLADRLVRQVESMDGLKSESDTNVESRSQEAASEVSGSELIEAAKQIKSIATPIAQRLVAEGRFFDATRILGATIDLTNSLHGPTKKDNFETSLRDFFSSTVTAPPAN